MVVLIGLTALQSALAQSTPTAESLCADSRCNPAARRPFVGFWISDTQGIRSQWFPGGDVGAAFAADMANMNTYYHSHGASCWTITETTPLGYAPLANTGGPWRAVDARRVSVASGVVCLGNPPGTYVGGASISGICGEGNQTGLRAGTDDACYCPTNMNWSESRQRCMNTRDRYFFTDAPNYCSNPPSGQETNYPTGNPIFPLLGSKRQKEGLGFNIGQETAAVVFDSLPKVEYPAGSGAVNGASGLAMVPPAALPGLWSSTLHKALIQNSPDNIQAYRGAGRWVNFTRSGGAFAATANVRDVLAVSGSGWRYSDRSAGAVETYDGAGRIISLAYRNGEGLTYSYSTASTAATQERWPRLSEHRLACDKWTGLGWSLSSLGPCQAAGGVPG